MQGFKRFKAGALCGGACAAMLGAPQTWAAEAPVELPAQDVIGSAVIEQNSVDTFGSLSTMVTREQIRDLNALDLSSALRRTPGVTVSRFNPVGSFGGAEGGAVYIRGMGASRPGSEIKTYVDGIPFYMGVWSHPLLDLLPVHGMQSIDVYKGPQPQKFGNTFAAIDLTPRQAAPGDNQHGDLQVTGGSFHTATDQASLIGRSGQWDYLLAQGSAYSAGDRPDGDGRLNNGMARLGYQLNDNWSSHVLLLHAENQVSDPGQQGKPGTSMGDFNTRGTLLSWSLDHQYDWAQGSLKLYHNEGRGSALDQPAPDGDTISDFTLQGVRWEEALRPWRNGEVSLGLEIDESSGEAKFKRIAPAPRDDFDTPTLRVTSPHVALSQSIALGERWTLTPSAGIRAYQHNVFDNATAPHAGVLLATDGLEFRANVSRGINYPGLDAAVMSHLIPALGSSWKDLDPERLDHQELGVKFQPLSDTTLDLALFKDRLKDRYLFAFPPTVSQPSFVNLGDYDMRGAEATWQQRWNSQWSSFLGFTWLDPSISTLPYAPRRSVSLGSTLENGPWRLSADAQYQSEMYVLAEERSAGASNYEQVGGFTVVNMRIGHQVPAFGPDGEVFVALENLFDRDYAYRPGYPMPGTSAQLGVRMGF
ncbi:TonB-dependent receptor plug domain-containing protein [Pseudomonas sp. PDM22]|uniref:TonB-dependent receptor plug domain-containing protein n=1 Tax=Pseudomonas sp. PDM22 TaxID=2769287 RepID=UPI001CE18379|nr:TonB-dependent receptor plug domain-containing protein [Pseudomonas sp. PDM22]